LFAIEFKLGNAGLCSSFVGESGREDKIAGATYMTNTQPGRTLLTSSPLESVNFFSPRGLAPLGLSVPFQGLSIFIELHLASRRADASCFRLSRAGSFNGGMRLRLGDPWIVLKMVFQEPKT
jgi:hypothetical protein